MSAQHGTQLGSVKPGEYAGFGYEKASRRAQEVCRIAAENGQTWMAYEHLSVLVPIMRQHMGDPLGDSEAA